jgi:hypothetical protein
MKLPLIVSVCCLSLMGCATRTVSHREPVSATADLPVKQPSATLQECDAVWHRILVVNILGAEDTNRSYSDEEQNDAIKYLDFTFDRKGLKKQFYNGICTTLNHNQAECMSNALSFEAMDMCEKAFE